VCACRRLPRSTASSSSSSSWRGSSPTCRGRRRRSLRAR
jgi:hypothetical protein